MPSAVHTLPFETPAEVAEILSTCPNFTLIQSVEQLVELSTAGADQSGWNEVTYEVPGQGPFVEARVCRTKNGIAANYTDPYMRRRDPDCMVIGDGLPTNKKRFNDIFEHDFKEIRQETFDWLKSQELVIFPFFAGGSDHGLPAVVIAPANAGFFALGLALLQGMLAPDHCYDDFKARAVIYVAPPF
ncbi:MAG: DUF4914 family protein, partial [Phycisphaeraceae bacterium]|nr:DUF4914 family protein [Phycisphaeraceae bacterium]